MLNCSVQFSCSVVSDSESPVLQASLSITSSRGVLKLMSIELVMPSSHLILGCLLLLSIFLTIWVFSKKTASQLLRLGCAACAELLGRVRLFETPKTVVCQAPLSMAFSRQENWRGSLCPSSGHVPNSGIELRYPTLQVDYLPSESPGKPKNTGVGSLSLLQGVFPTQELNKCLLHCRQILY